MSETTEKTDVLKELRTITGRRLALTDIWQWSPSEAFIRRNHPRTHNPVATVVHCPVSGIWCAVRESALTPAAS